MRILVHGDLLPPRRELDALARLIREVGMGISDIYIVDVLNVINPETAIDLSTMLDPRTNLRIFKPFSIDSVLIDSFSWSESGLKLIYNIPCSELFSLTSRSCPFTLLLLLNNVWSSQGVVFWLYERLDPSLIDLMSNFFDKIYVKLSTPAGMKLREDLSNGEGYEP